MTDATHDLTQLDIREKLAHIDQMLGDHDCERQEISAGALAIAGKPG
jgi:hypothetical protein